MSKISTLIEEISGGVSFCIGLIFLFIAGQMAFYIRNAGEAILPVVIAIWSVALLLTSRRAGRRVVLFRIVSISILVIGTVVAAILLPPLKRS
ncbi:MAG: hypothetical protein WB566_17475 [Terriglobales bacterium]